MRRLLIMVIVVMLTFSITACGTKVTEEATAEPTEQPQHESEQQDASNVIDTVLVNYQKVYEETKDELISNNGENIGTEADMREVSDEGIVFTAGDGENPFMPFAKRLDEVDGATSNQAFYMKFKPSKKDFGFMMSADVSAGITIGEENEPVLFVMNHEYMEPLEGDLRIEPDNWYHVLLAMGSDGLMQGAIWKDGEENIPSYLNLHIGKSFGDSAYENQSWEISLGFQGEATLTVDYYAYYKFEDFCMPDRVIEMGNNVQGPQSKDDVLYSMLMNPKELWSEGSNGFAENDGGEFGGGVKKGYNADIQRLEIFGEDTGACAKFNTSLMTCMSDVGMDKTPQQAVLVKFSASDISNGVRVSFDALDEINFWFGDDGVKFVDVANFLEMPITDFMPNNLELKDDTIYYFFFAFDEKGNIRVFIWEDGTAGNQAYFEYDLYQDPTDINNCDLIMHLAVGANDQFNLYEYWVYTFDSFMDGLPPFMESDDKQNGNMQNVNEDYGPAWTINIAGNFDIISDLVWQSVELQDINAGGDTFKGYNLADMMTFSGNGSDRANVAFGHEGAENAEVEPTHDAYIVFKKNDEFLGGPFLLSANGLSEFPVIEVHID